MTRFVPLILWLVLPSVLKAQDASRASCDSAATAVNVRRCFEHALQTAERDLQRYVDEARRRAANRTLLDSAEVAWRRYRDLDCSAAGSLERRGSTRSEERRVGEEGRSRWSADPLKKKKKK